MHVTHELKFSRQCPINSGLDSYDCRLETSLLITVEDILAAIETLPAKAFQEEITNQLATRLRCRVTTIGFHSGVKTTVTAGE